MPQGLRVGYPTGQSWDENGQVQLDSGPELAGGVQPDLRVPLTMESLRAIFLEGQDTALKYALKALESEQWAGSCRHCLW